MLFKKYIVLCAFVFGCLVSRSQDCNLVIRGLIQDKDDSETLSFAVVKLLQTEKVFQTNDKGEFVFQNLCAGLYSLQVQHAGCKDTIFTVDLKKSRNIVLKLPHNLNNLQEIDVMDKRQEMKKTQTVDELSQAEIQSTKGQSLGDVLKNISGVTTLNTGATISKPMVHGMQGYRLLILNNGIRQEGQQWGNEHAPEIDPFMAKKFSVIKGVSAIRYGSDAIAGVVLVEPNELPDSAGVTGEINLVGLSNGQTGAASGIMEGSFDKLKGLSWRMQGSLKKGGTVRTPDYYLNNTGIQERNFSYALGYHHKKWGVEMYYSQFNTTIGIFKGSHVGNLTDLANALSLNKPVDSLAVFTYSVGRPNQEVAHELIKGLTHYHFSAKWRAKFQYAWQYNIRKEFDLRRLTSLEKQTGVVNPDLDLRIASQTADIILEHDNIRSLRGMFGLSYMNQKNVYLGRFFIPNYVSNSFGVFATERYVKPFFEVELGVRYDEKYLQSYFYEGKDWKEHPRNFKNYTYNAGFIWKPRTDFNIFVNGGSAWRAPAPNELYSNGIHQGAGAIERGNPDFKSETCTNITVTGIYKTKRLNVELSAYYNRFKNFIYLSPTGELELTIRGAFPVFSYKQDKVRISGIDFRADYQITNSLSFVTKGMIVRAWNYTVNDYLIYMPADRADLNLKLKLPELKTLRAGYMQINNQFVSKQWRAPKNIDFAQPPPAYYLLGTELGTEFLIKKQRFLVNLSVTNLLNTRYREYLDRFRYYCDALGVSYNLRITVPLVLYKKHIN
jgi:iron complex outermembrane recepter protein